MAMPISPEPRRYTVAEVLDFPPDGNRYEVVGGELLVTPAPRYRHQLLVTRLVGVLLDYLKSMGLADCVLTGPADITWGQRPREAEELVQPDPAACYFGSRLAERTLYGVGCPHTGVAGAGHRQVVQPI